MERNRKAKQLLDSASELFDLPPDAVAGLPHVEVLGNARFYMERHRGVVSYSDREIAVSGGRFIVRVCGECLQLVSMTEDALRIEGSICRVEWVD